LINISDRSALLHYLEERDVFCEASELLPVYFSGGVSSTVAMVSNERKSVIVKQALPQLKVTEEWLCDPARMHIEHEALSTYARLVPDNVPHPIFYDEDNFIMVREAVPDNYPMWKMQLLNGLLDFATARRTIDVLLTVHNEAASLENIRDTFNDNRYLYILRINPYIEYVINKHPFLKEKSENVCRTLMQEKITLIHGDFSPKNILVSPDKVFILDMEVACFGHPAFDIAFLMTHFLLKSIKHKEWCDAYLNMLSYMAEIYFSGVTCMNAVELERESVNIMAFILLARVDGKSPAEYITEEADKELIRRISLSMINDVPYSFADVTQIRKTIV
jgi:hypothetical protein